MATRGSGKAGVQRYDYDDIQRILTVLAITNNANTASQRLKRDYGIEIGQSGVRAMKDRHPEDYQRIREQIAPQIHAQVASEAEDLVKTYVGTLHKLSKRLDEEVAEIPARDLAKTIVSLNTAVGISFDKALLGRQRPTRITEHRDVGEIMREIGRLMGAQEDVKPEPKGVPRRVQNLEPKAT